jgi:hypothetical protein
MASAAAAVGSFKSICALAATAHDSTGSAAVLRIFSRASRAARGLPLWRKISALVTTSSGNSADSVSNASNAPVSPFIQQICASVLSVKSVGCAACAILRSSIPSST